MKKNSVKFPGHGNCCDVIMTLQNGPTSMQTTSASSTLSSSNEIRLHHHAIHSSLVVLLKRQRKYISSHPTTQSTSTQHLLFLGRQSVVVQLLSISTLVTSNCRLDDVLKINFNGYFCLLLLKLVQVLNICGFSGFSRVDGDKQASFW